MALRRTLRRRAGTSGPAAGHVQIPLQSEDLKAAVEQLQESLNELVTRFNAHTHGGVTAGGASTGATSAPVTGTIVADAGLFTPPAST